ncbi:hypothetical protein CDD82_3243 [Ophiocordyceps australis]|uniref:Apurinic-apyrimidinic endonuclease 1 n=1 Tax=Ophiocordyceps australis TaxID=1399860 RepID=A0A2C5ZEB9_9HYPO|nr:hypothetical protein CDD82_3243 [Ophiocordyceps australis]
MPRSSLSKKQTGVSYPQDCRSADEAESLTAAPKSQQRSKSSVEKRTKRPAEERGEEEEEEEEEEKEKEKKGPAAKKQKTKAKASKAHEAGGGKMAMAGRTTVSTLKKAMYIGAHVSAAGGVDKAVGNAVEIGANAFALFLKSQRKWSSPPLTPEARNGFISACKTHNMDASAHALPHGSYLVNLAQGDAAKAEQAYTTFLDDLRRCEQLGIRLYNFHPGSTLGGSRDEAVARIAAQLNRAHGQTERVVTVLENMAGGGNVLGGPWEDLRDIIALVKDKERVGVCLDTCHAFAAGHDVRTPEALEQTMEAFDRIVGLGYLKALHLNDSKAPLKSHRDLHANIGTGFLGLRAFHAIVNTDAFAGLPMVLETPIERAGSSGKPIEDRSIWAEEIKLLERLVGMDPSGDEFVGLERQLSQAGAAERQRIQGQVDKKAAKGRGGKRAAAKGGRGKARNTGAEERDDDESG